MKKKYYLLFCLSILLLSCQNELHEEEYQLQVNYDEVYTIENNSSEFEEGGNGLRVQATNIVYKYDEFRYPARDITGQIEIGYGYWDTKYINGQYQTPQHHNTYTTVVPAGWVCIGGGAITYGINNDIDDPNENISAYLTESRPATGSYLFKGWVVSSKDHVDSYPHWLRIYVVGMRIKDNDGNYLAEEEVKSYLKLYTKTSDLAQHPSTTVVTPTFSEEMISGGAKTNWSTQGCLLTKSIPYGNYGWSVSGKDHDRPETTTITAYAITIKNNIPNFGSIISAKSSYSGKWVSTGNVETVYNKTFTSLNNFIMVCPGIISNYSGSGRLIKRLSIYGGTSYSIVRGKTKDHKYVSAGNIILEPLMIKKQ